MSNFSPDITAGDIQLQVFKTDRAKESRTAPLSASGRAELGAVGLEDGTPDEVKREELGGGPGGPLGGGGGGGVGGVGPGAAGSEPLSRAASHPSGGSLSSAHTHSTSTARINDKNRHGNKTAAQVASRYLEKPRDAFLKSIDTGGETRSSH
ncbi:hypothetical protein AAG570_003526 [Ranatra chinensis]|uniref:Uncharacterized protein n=1 Tax=Ranatra chinensis TaxID=642074 RepID=A0ABD0Y3X4_9HEMI